MPYWCFKSSSLRTYTRTHAQCSVSVQCCFTPSPRDRSDNMEYIWSNKLLTVVFSYYMLYFRKLELHVHSTTNLYSNACWLSTNHYNLAHTVLVTLAFNEMLSHRYSMWTLNWPYFVRCAAKQEQPTLSMSLSINYCANNLSMHSGIPQSLIQCLSAKWQICQV